MKIALVARVPNDENVAVTGPSRVSSELLKNFQSLDGIDVEYVKLKYTDAIYRRFIHLIRTVYKMREQNINMVVISGNSLQIPFLVLCVKILTNCCTTYITHGLVFFEKAGQKAPCLRERIIFRLVDGLICISPKQADLLQKQYPDYSEKISVIPHGVSDSYLVPHWSTRKPSISFVGRVSQAKGFDTFARAIKKIDQPFDVYIAGPIGDCGELLDDIKSSPFINFNYLGYINQDALKSLYKATSILVLPSVYESFGLVVLEAMASGCSVVLSDAVGASSVYRDRVDFVSFPTGNSDELANVLNQLLKDNVELERIARNGMQQAKNNTWQHVTEKYLEVLSNIEKSEE